MDRRVERSGEHIGELQPDRSGEIGRYPRMQSRWPSGSPTNQHHRFPRGGVGDVGGGEGFPDIRFHPYRAQPDFFHPGGGRAGGLFRGGQGFRDGPGGFGGQQMPMGGFKRGFEGRAGSPDYGDANKIAKLFIGSVPRTATEEDIRPLFEEHGEVIEVALIKDRRTGQQQGCCFIKYATPEQAERAIRALHNQYTLPGGTAPIQVRYADGERERLVEDKLFVASLNKWATEKEVEEIFAPYGHVEDVYLMKDEMKLSRGCGFVKFSSREMALAAINALHGTFVMRGCDQPLIVRFAEPKRPRQFDQRAAPSFGGPGFGPAFGPRSDAIMPNRQMSNFDEPGGGGQMLHKSWDSFSPPSGGPQVQPSHVFGNHTNIKSGIAPTIASSGPGSFGEGGAHNNGSMHNLAPISSAPQQSFASSMAQAPQASVQQILPMHKSPIGSQNLQSSLPSQNTLISSSSALSQGHPQAPIQQHGQHQIPQSVGINPLNQNLLAHQFPGLALIQQNPSILQQQGATMAPNQQQLPSQMLLQQQAQSLQSSYQTSQQAIFQIQQQIQMLQQQASLPAKQQTQWNGQPLWAGPAPASSTPAGAPATIPLTAPVGTQAILSCNWTEHTSPEGFKYYYNSATRESKWEKPDELTLFEQQKLLLLQHQKVAQSSTNPPLQALVQQPLQQASHPQVQQPLQQASHLQVQQPLQQASHQQVQLPLQQASHQQVQQPLQQVSHPQIQAQMQLRQAQLQILQPSLTYPSSGASGHPGAQDLGYAHLQGVSSVNDSARAQEWAWKNKTGGS